MSVTDAERAFAREQVAAFIISAGRRVDSPLTAGNMAVDRMIALGWAPRVPGPRDHTATLPVEFTAEELDTAARAIAAAGRWGDKPGDGEERSPQSVRWSPRTATIVRARLVVARDALIARLAPPVQEELFDL